MKILFFMFICLSAWGQVGSALRYLPVQSGGRVKPFDTFARESVEFISGRSQGKSSIHITATWILLPTYWDNHPFVLVQNAHVKKALKLELSKDRYSPHELIQNKFLTQEISELQIKKNREEKLSTYFKEVEKIHNRLLLYQAVKQGILPLWMPEGQAFYQLSNQRKQELISVLTQYSRSIVSQKDQKLIEAVKTFQEPTKSADKISGWQNAKLKAEVHYNSLNPFRWSWVLYLLGLFLWTLFILKPQYPSKVLYIFLTSAFILNTYGIILRCFIMSRPPVSNMFETLLWVPWAGIVLAFIFSRIKKIEFPLIASMVGSFLCLFLADQAEGILNGKLEPLEAVLRSNFWLSTHVLVITMSYSAFLLSFIMGDFLVIRYLLGKPLNMFKNHFWFLTRCLQVGVLLLALGTILGAVWADYSWGRFWGWDPKEVWALVSLLGYLALLHARLQGWVKEFGLAIGSISCFFLIIMAWYGVNFILGKGLHSYGFGEGGLSYVLVFAGLHAVLVFLAWRKKKLS